MKRAWTIFRAIAVGLLLLAVVVPTSLYVLLSMEPVQRGVRDTASHELSKLLGADVNIENVTIHPFNRLAIRGVSIAVGRDTVATAATISAGFELRHFLRTGELIIDYALVDGVSLRIWRDEPASPLNVQPVLDHLRSRRRSDTKSAFELRINTVVLRNGSLTYDILSEPSPQDGRFDRSHIAVCNLSVNAYIPQISSSRYRVELDHLSFDERSGFSLSQLQAKVDFGSNGARLSDFLIAFPHSRLALAPVALEYDGYSDISRALSENPLSISTAQRSVLYPPDFQALVPQLAFIESPLSIDIDATASTSAAELRHLRLADTDQSALTLSLRGRGSKSPDGKIDYAIENCSAVFDGYELAAIAGRLLPASARRILEAIPSAGVNIKASGSEKDGHIDIKAGGTPGNATISGSYRRIGHSWHVDGKAVLDKLDVGLLSGNKRLSDVSGELEGTATLGYKSNAQIKATVSELCFDNYCYTGISASVDMKSKKLVEARVSMNDPSAIVHAYTFYNAEDTLPSIQATATLANVDFHTIGLDKKRPDYRFGAKLNINVAGRDADSAKGTIEATDIRWLDLAGKGLQVERLAVNADNDNGLQSMTIDSDVLRGSITGRYSFASIVPEMKGILARFIPAVFAAPEPKRAAKTKAKQLKPNVFEYEFTLLPSEEVTRFFELPVHIVYDAEISGRIDSRQGRATLEFDAPYLRNGDKLIEGSTLHARLDTAASRSDIYLSTQFPTNKGDMALNGLIKAFDNRIDTRIDWIIERKIPLNGSLSFATQIGEPSPKLVPGALCPWPLTVHFNPGTVNFGDETWTIKPSTISLDGDMAKVEGFGLDAGSQAIAIDGLASKNPADSLIVDLRSIALLPIFETLEIDKAMIGGRATGRFTARDVLTKTPKLYCPSLHVDSIGYNRCTIGDADIEAGWDNDARAFAFDADITGLDKRKSRITGKIFPMDEALDIDFNADRVPVGFLKPFMEAFTSDISGHASGHCRLFGTFKEIDLEGRVFADNVKMKIDFTNTSYTATDSVYLSPGSISLRNITIHDAEGHTARLNGTVRHTFFKRPVFKFDISGAHNFLSFNATPKQYPDWYGTIYGNGGASISGYPGVVNIDVDMTTAPRSSFTFILSDRLDAETYSFINFRDATPDSLRVKTAEPDNTPAIVRELKNKIQNSSEEEPSAYNMDLRVGITKDAQMTLVMDPMAGDEIKATGEGNLHLAYHSLDNALNIWGAYEVLSGSYRFTLQDIIIRDFTIKEGSEIRFDGDPYGVKTNLTAYYATNANLTDLDESFQQDKDINRTNVPVHALMLVNGDIRQPSIDFDLEFPTLTQDTYRKVRSIVSTTDMMNRQIIYLLALNRFYTPDYMASTTKGSELFSVASSTISSQLGNMLGKLSDNWSIAPNLRSDRGDFSDVEVDLMLSSRLLNNRLLFNGNFGYRDKSLNTNQFIGDFDIEYLLNKRGSWRLKAYNRYNDRNYYVRSAQTTQGIGIMFRRDFDDFLSFMRKFRKKPTPSDSTTNAGDTKR